MRHRNFGLRKVCACGRSRWPRCGHAWYLNFKPKGGPHYRLSLDVELGRHIYSKTEAEKIATTIRAAILAGTFERAADRYAREQREASERLAASANGVTLDVFAKVYTERVSKANGKASWKDDEWMLSAIGEYRAADGRRLGDFPLGAITEDELEAFYASLVSAGRAASTRNHYVQLLKAAFRWAAKKGYISRSPISEDSALVRSKHAKRSRRVPPDEEAGLLKAAQVIKRSSVWLYGLMVAAIETGCRLGELLALQWADVDLDRLELRIRSETAKDDELRRLPISTRLAAVLDMARLDPAGRRYPPAAYVFGLFGEPVGRINKAWETCVLRAHGHEPQWVKGKLSEASRATLRSIDLHFHDLRHEAGSRWLEAGWPLHHVRAMLGHANVSQTDTYLNAARMGLHDSMRRFDAIRCNPVAKEQPIEHRPDGNEEPPQSDKSLLH